MRVVHAGAQYGIALTLIALGVLGVLATHEAFIPCWGVEQSVPACLDAMDGPEHIVALQVYWLWALGLSVAAALLARGRGAPWVASSAVIVVLAMNSVTEYIIWLGVYGGHWDVPPGTGYSMAGAMILAGLLVTVSATLGLKKQTSAGPPAEEEEAGVTLVAASPDASSGLNAGEVSRSIS